MWIICNLFFSGSCLLCLKWSSLKWSLLAKLTWFINLLEVNLGRPYLENWWLKSSATANRKRLLLAKGYILYVVARYDRIRGAARRLLLEEQGTFPQFLFMFLHFPKCYSLLSLFWTAGPRYTFAQDLQSKTRTRCKCRTSDQYFSLCNCNSTVMEEFSVPMFKS